MQSRVFRSLSHVGMRRLSTRSGAHAGDAGPGVHGNGGTGAPFALGAAGLLPFIYWGLQHDKIDTKAPAYFNRIVERVISAGIPAQFFLSKDQETVRRRFVTCEF